MEEVHYLCKTPRGIELFFLRLSDGLFWNEECRVGKYNNNYEQMAEEFFNICGYELIEKEYVTSKKK